MKVNLISYTQNPKLDRDQDIPDPSKEMTNLVAYCARVSNPSNQMNNETSEKLLKYLMYNRHWSPFEMVNICLEIETTRDIARQILRHRSFSFQEFSQRYANVDAIPDDNFVIREARLQDEKNRQNSIKVNDIDLQIQWTDKQSKAIATAKEAYDWAIRKGIAKEQARCVLPEGNTKSRLYMNGTLRSWLHYIELRTDESTQLEHREVAQECGKIIGVLVPSLFEDMI